MQIQEAQGAALVDEPAWIITHHGTQRRRDQLPSDQLTAVDRVQRGRQ